MGSCLSTRFAIGASAPAVRPKAPMKKLLPLPLLSLLLAVLPLLAPAPAAAEDERSLLLPYESDVGFEPAHAIDMCVLAELQAQGIQPSNRCSDEVFLRRVFVDVLGMVPTIDDVDRFLLDRRDGKRERLIEAVLEREEFIDYWTLKWGDILRVKSEFPIKLWPNGVQAYHRWIRDALKENRPYDRFAHALLTASGSNFRVPPVNFWRGAQGKTPEDLAAVVALTFLGERFELWPEAKRQGFAAFFSRVVFKPTAEWKEEIVVYDPEPKPPVEAVFPDGTKVTIPSDRDPRRVFAEWLMKPGNPYFARAFANRVWSWLLGRGVVHEADDIRADNPPLNPALLTCLEREFVAANYDVKQMFRLILGSRTYQGSPIPQSDDPRAEGLFAHYGVRRLPAEVLLDTLSRLDGRGADYVSPVPEPFTIIPGLKRSVLLKDGTITSPLLEMFGRPPRDSGYESERDNDPTAAQVLHLLNSSDVQNRIERGPWLRRLVNQARRDPLAPIRPIYLALLSRDPTAAEMARAAVYFKEHKPQEAAVDLAWALINSKEFLFRH